MTARKPDNQLSRLGSMILASTVVILVIVWTAVILGLQSLYKDAIRNQIQESNNTSRVLQEQIVRVLAMIDKVTVRANESTTEASQPAEALTRIDAVRLANETGLFPDILLQLGIVDAQGFFRFSNLDPRGEKSSGVDLSEREHIRAHLRPETMAEVRQHINEGGLFLGRPVLGKVSNRWTIQMTRKLQDRTGQTAGVVVASVDPVYFEQVFKDVQLGPEGTIALIGDDDIIRAQVVGGTNQGMGSSLVLAQPDPEGSRSALHTHFMRTDADGRQHLVVSRHIPGYPLRLTVSTSTEWALVNWHETRRITLILATLLSLVATLGAVFFVRAIRKIEHQSAKIFAQNQLQEMTMDAMQDGVLQLDRKGLLVEANPMALELLGMRKDTVIGARIEEVLPGEQQQRRMSDWFAFDLTQLRQYLARQIQLVSGKTPAIPVPLISLDPDGRILWATTTACELLALDPSHPQPDALAAETVAQVRQAMAAGQTHHGRDGSETDTLEISWGAGDLRPLKLPTLLIPEASSERSVVFWIMPSTDALAAYAIRTLHNIEWNILRSDDATITPVLLTASPLLDPYSHLSGAVLTMKDVRDVKEKEEENLRMVKKMERSQKLDALGQLAAGVAHDFNNLLGMIQSHAELVEMKVGPNSPAQKNLNAIMQAITRAHNIVLTLNSLGRDAKHDGEVATDGQSQFDLLTLLYETQSLLQASLKGIDIRLETEGILPEQIMLKGESGALQQVLVNLCVNASHAIGENSKGRIKIEISCASDGFVDMNVRDNGSGIPPDILPRIFEPFFTTKSVGKGTGLGLAMVHSIITKMDGTIDCQSEVGVGTCFCIRLPRLA